MTALHLSLSIRLKYQSKIKKKKLKKAIMLSVGESLLEFKSPELKIKFPRQDNSSKFYNRS